MTDVNARAPERRELIEIDMRHAMRCMREHPPNWGAVASWLESAAALARTGEVVERHDRRAGR